MTSVRTESSTILVVADISLVTLTPAKLKKAMLTTVPVKIIVELFYNTRDKKQQTKECAN